MKIFIDADAIPGAIRDILFRASEKNRIQTTVVANQRLKLPDSNYISGIEVPSGPDAADDLIVELVSSGDLVITADIPLADRVISRGAYVLNHRGEFYDMHNIKERLTMRNLMEDLRSIGIDTGGQGPLSHKDRNIFAGQLDRIITDYLKKTGER
ncbi:MAG TPA: YaiI/YqxD family protein [Spirochaetota bacterium]|nr:YaiI/YqxD family protein [Spirochaetota bacterium]HPF06903.1 YaiI/YqxD family protein [Spirochaetota bacterium]HPJ43187.1 YaiI/YqxD family protein [Spirochaetota bacterium]HPR38137.1 YaiI/YqxD family protein [Spirochaetota bacterium]HRX48396.1 YaiI/YqxD family protein [Spirochaetota bacterium]